MEFPLPKDHCSDVMSKVFRMLSNPSLCDLSIVIEDRVFWAHRCVFIAACPMLHDIVIKESKSSPGGNLQFTLQGLSSTGFEALLAYIYTGRTPDVADRVLFAEFMKACRVLGVAGKKTDPPRECETAPRRQDQTRNAMFGSTSKSWRSGQVVIEISTNGAGEEMVEVEMGDDEKEKIESGKSNGTFDITALFSVTKRANHATQSFSQQPAMLKAADNIDTSTDARNTSSQGSVSMDVKRETVGCIPPRPKRRGGRPRISYDHIFPLRPPFVCPFSGCEKTTDTREKLKKHYRNHGEKTFECEVCGKKFLYRKDLPIHVRSHTGERPYQCATCGKGFTQKPALKLHVATHVDEDAPRFPCETCGKVYAAHRALRMHMKVKHSPDAQAKYVCSRCGKEYKTRASFSSHVESACGAPAFLCTKCGVRYKKSRPFERHVRACTGAAATVEYQCGLCGDTFPRKAAAESHIQFVHDARSEDGAAVHVTSRSMRLEGSVQDDEVVSFANVML